MRSFIGIGCSASIMPVRGTMAWASMTWGAGVLPAAATSVEALGPSAAASKQLSKASSNFIARFILWCPDQNDARIGPQVPLQPIDLDNHRPSSRVRSEEHTSE